MAILEVKNIGKQFDSTKVLDDVSFSLEEGNALPFIVLRVPARRRFCGV